MNKLHSYLSLFGFLPVLTFLVNWLPVEVAHITKEPVITASAAPVYPAKQASAACVCDRFQDSLALVALYNNTGGSSWTNKTNWLSSQPINTWYGVTAGVWPACVTCLDLDGNVDCGSNANSGNHLVGTIPNDFAQAGRMEALQVLSLSYNDPSVGNFGNLTGSIPDNFSNLTSLTHLFLFQNTLTGPIPTSLSSLGNLQQLFLYQNNLTDGIPEDLGSLSSLMDLRLFENPSLGGSLPPGMFEPGELPVLQLLGLASCGLTGGIPAELGNLNNLAYLYLHNNNLEGCIPEEVQALCPHVITGNISGNPLLETQSWTNFCTIQEGMCSTCAPYVATLTNDGPICLGEEATLFFDVTGGTEPYFLQYTDGVTTYVVTSMAFPAALPITPTATTTYTVTNISDMFGCPADLTGAVTTVVVNAPPTLSVGADIIICEDETINLSADSPTAIGFEWSGPNGFSSNLQNPSIPNVTTAASGTYSVTATDANGCTATNSMNAVVNAAPSLLTGSNSPVCEGDDIQLTESIGAAIDYDWTGPNGFSSPLQNPVIPSASSLAAGDYTLVATGANGCTSQAVVSVDVLSFPLAVAVSNSPVCEGETLDLAISVGTAWAWSGPNGFSSNQQNPSISNVTVAASGTYTVTVTAANGCTASYSTSVTIHEAPSITGMTTDSVSCFSGADGSIEPIVSGGTPSYLFQWSNGTSLPIATGLSAGIYTVTVTDQNGCSVNAGEQVSEPSDLTLSCMPAANPLGTVTLTIGGGTASYSYVLTGPGGAGAPVNVAGTVTLNNLPAGDYIVDLTDFNGCTELCTFSINSAGCAGFQLDVTSSNVTCNGGNDGTATVAATGGTAPYAFDWSNGEQTATITGLMSGTYIVTVTDNDGCSFTESTNVAQPAAALTLSCGQQSPASSSGSNDGVATVNFSGGVADFDYAWSGGAPPISGSANNAAAGSYTVSTLTPGSYVVTVTDASNCTKTCAFVIDTTVVVPPCDSLTCGLVGHFELDGNAQNAAEANPGTAQNMSWGKDWDGNCERAGEFNGVDAYISVPSSPELNSPTTSITLAGWAKADPPNAPQLHGFISKTTGSTVQYRMGVAPNVAGDINFYFTAMGNVSREVKLSGGSYDPTEWYHYAVAWDGDSIRFYLDGNLFGAPQSFVGSITPGNAPLEIGRDVHGATEYAHGSLDDLRIYDRALPPVEIAALAALQPTNPNPPPVAAAAAQDSTICQGNSTTLNASPTLPGLIYQWLKDSISIPGATGQTFQANQSGSYQVLVTQSAGCDSLSPALPITVNPLPQVSASATDPTPCEQSPLELSANATGQGSLGYAWTGPNGFSSTMKTLVFSNATLGLSGNYIATATDANGCSASASVAVDVQAVPQPEFGAAVQTCASQITLDAGFPNVVWSTGATTQTITVNQSDTYSATVTAANGCTAADAVDVAFDSVLTTQLIETICEGDTFLVGTSSYTASDTYVDTLTSFDHCDSIVTTNLTVALLPNIDLGADQQSCNPVTLDAGQVPPGGSLLWSTGETSPSVTVSQTSTVSVVLTDGNGCTASDAVSFTLLPAPTLDLGADVDTCASQITLDAGTPNTVWSTGASTQTIVVSQSGNYSAVVTGANGCTASDAVQVNFMSIPPPSPQVSGSPTPCAAPGNVFSISNFDVSLSYVWNVPPNATFQGGGSQITVDFTGVSGSSTVGVTAANACGSAAGSFPVNVQAAVLPTPVFLSGNQMPCADSQEIYLVTAVPDAAEYVWTTPAGSTVTTTSPSLPLTLASGGGGQLCVRAKNTCGMSDPAACLQLTAVSAPSTAIFTSATASLCANDLAFFEVNAGGNASIYHWQTPGGIVSTLEPSLSLTWGAANGQVCVFAENACGAASPACTSVTVVAAPAAILSGDTSTCPGGFATLTVNFTGTPPWNFSYSENGQPPMQVNGVTANPYSWQVNPAQPANYLLTEVSDAGGCDGGSVSGNAAVTVIEPTLISQSATMCQGGTYDFNDVTLDTSGMYFHTIFTPAGCDSIITELTLTETPAPTFDTAGVICQGDTFEFYDTLLTAPGTYYHTISAQGSCDTIIRLSLDSMLAPLATLSGGDAICPGETSMLLVDFTGTPPWNFTYSASGQPGISISGIPENSYLIQVSPAQTTTYSLLEAWNGGECDVELSGDVQVAVLEWLELAAVADSFHLSETEAEKELDLTQNDSIPGSGWHVKILQAPLHGTLEDLGGGRFNYLPGSADVGVDGFTYAICQEGCESHCDTASVKLSLHRDCIGEAAAEIPNVFTPNDDGFNDVFHPLQPFLSNGCVASDVGKNAELTILNRWGEAIFRAESYKEWDGKYKSGKEVLPAGTYYYYLRIKTREGVIEKKGAVSLLW